MAANSLGWRRVRQALTASGLGTGATLGLIWPIGREKRSQALLRQRRSVLEAKNHVLEYLSRRHRPLVPLGLARAEQVQEALSDPDKRRLVMAVGANRAMIEEELVSRSGAEVGRSLDRALAELESEGVALKVSAMPASADVVYILAYGRARQRYDLSQLNRLLEQGKEYGARLRARLRTDDSTQQGRVHRL